MLLHIAQEQLKSRKRVQQLLVNAIDPREVSELQEHLRGYRSEGILRQQQEHTPGRIKKAKSALVHVGGVYKSAVAKEMSSRRRVIEIDRAYGIVLGHITKEFGDIEMTCHMKEEGRRLDVYFGGKDFPLGEGHAHWVFKGSTLIYRRDPGKRR